MTYHQAIDFLYNLRLFGTKLGLENTFYLCELFGNPQQNIQFIHVAGTNGKGSTCAMLERIYRGTGLKTGLFTSPHLVSFTERIQVNRIPISEEEVAALTEKMLQALVRANGDELDHEKWQFRPTFFEVVTVMALIYFAEKRCDLVIWETGMGGRLDATNIVQPLAAIITNVQLDHQSWLGETPAEIAREKAGIIKPGVPVITATSEPSALQVIKQTAIAQNSPLTIIDEGAAARVGNSLLSLKGNHQRWNAACASATVEILQHMFPAAKLHILQGLNKVQWPGRFQVVAFRGTPLIFDGAHNPDGAQSLVKSLASLFPRKRPALVLGLFKDKAWQRMCEILLPVASALFLAPVQSQRSAHPSEVANYCRKLNPLLPISEHPNLATALDAALQNDFVLVTGSLHFVGEAMELLGVSPSHRSERSLNEWTALKP